MEFSVKPDGTALNHPGGGFLRGAAGLQPSRSAGVFQKREGGDRPIAGLSVSFPREMGPQFLVK